jgi:hypothetical protein
VARSTRGSTWAVHQPVRTAARPAVVCGGTVCDGTESFGCGGSSRAGGVGHRGTHTGWVAPASSGEPAPVVVVAVDIGDWPTRVATDSTMEVAADGKGLAAGIGNRAVLALKSI